MRFRVLALDYDGTIAQGGKLHPEVRAAIDDARAKGIAVILVTGRILEDLRREAGNLQFLDAVVAENGAVLAFPGKGRSMALGPRPSFLRSSGAGKSRLWPANASSKQKQPWLTAFWT